MNTMTLTEQRLCRTWAQHAQAGTWFECYDKLHEVAMILRLAGCDEAVVQTFIEASELALEFSILAIRERKAA